MSTAVAPAPSQAHAPSTPPTKTPSPFDPAEIAAAPEAQLSCPACGEPAVVEWRDTVAGTSGPVVHVKLRCPRGRHWFLMPEDDIS